MNGGINLNQDPYKDNDFIAMYELGWKDSAASASPTSTIARYSRDYLSYASGIFTVKKPCSLKFTVIGKGSYKLDSGGAGTNITFSITATINNVNQTIHAGTLAATGTLTSTTGSNGAIANFNIGDTFQMSITHNHNASRAGVDGGMFIQLSK